MKSELRILACGLMLGLCAFAQAQEVKEPSATIELKDLKSADLIAPIVKYLATEEAKAALEPIADLLAVPLEKAPLVLVLDDGLPATLTWKCLKPGLSAEDSKKAQAALKTILTNAVGQSNLLQEADATKLLVNKLTAVVAVDAKKEVAVEPKKDVPKPPAKADLIALNALTEVVVRERLRTYLATKEGQSFVAPLADTLPGLSVATLYYDPAFGGAEPKSLVWRALKKGAAQAEKDRVEAGLRLVVLNALGQHPEAMPSNLFVEVNGATAISRLFRLEEVGSGSFVPITPPVVPVSPPAGSPPLPVLQEGRMPQEPLAIGISGWTYPPYYGFTPWYVGGFYPTYGYGYGYYPFDYSIAPGYYAPRWYGGYVFPPVLPSYCTIARTSTGSADLTGDADALYGRGRNRYFDCRYDEAATILKAAIRKDGEDARMWYFLSLSQKALGRNAEAEESARRGQAAELVNGRDDRVIGSLEKVQGESRLFLRGFREAPLTREEARAIASKPVDPTPNRMVGAK